VEIIGGAIILTLVATLFYGAGLVITQFALRFAPPWRGAAISVPSAALMFWCLSPFMVDAAQADFRAVLIFAAIGVLFPASVTLLSMEANRRMGPNVAGAAGNTAPLFAVLFAVIVLGEALHAVQAAGIAVIVGGVMLLSVGRMAAVGHWVPWVLALPLAAAIVRGAAPPAVKLGLVSWPDPFAATLISYTVSAAVLVSAALIRCGGRLPRVDMRGRCWFIAVGFCNGFAVLLMYAALARAPVTLVSPLFAAYPLVTLLLSRLLLRQEQFSARLAIGVAATVAGVVLLIAGQAP
jgi:drug/metabolite transporter (DMT)-like permease